MEGHADLSSHFVLGSSIPGNPQEIFSGAAPFCSHIIHLIFAGQKPLKLLIIYSNYVTGPAHVRDGRQGRRNLSKSEGVHAFWGTLTFKKCTKYARKGHLRYKFVKKWGSTFPLCP